VGEQTAFLGVERSASGRRWRLRGIADDGTAAAIAAQLAVPDMLARMLTQRGVGLAEAARFLSPRLRDQLPDPAHLKDMDRAVERLVRAIREGEKIVVYGDYDVDGATSAALLLRFFAAVGAAGDLYVPDRMREGYGPNAPALIQLKQGGARLVITVDCGTTAHDALDAAKIAGLDLIVIDHHVAEPLLPSAVAVVNPNRLDEESAHGHLAAVGVVFLLAIAANRALREAGWYRTRPEPDLMQWLDLVALGTVCDVVPLTGLNRVLVAQGLKVAARGANPGMAALAALAQSSGRANGRPTAIDAYQLGFVLGPRVNAGGRVGAADLGARLLATDDKSLAAEWAQHLDAYNKERREIEAQTLAAAIDLVERQNAESPVLVFAAGEGWHPGVIGIVAARLRERYERPAVVVALADGVGKGSGRSVPGLDLGSAVIAARQTGLLINGGGHAMAAGFTVAADKLVELQEFLAARLNDGLDRACLVPELAIDAALSAEAAQGDLLTQLEALAPFGSANPEPRFAFPAVRAQHVERVGSDHLRLRIADAVGGGQLNAIAFRAADTPVGGLIAEAKGRAIHLAGHLRRDTWRGGGAVQLVVDDAAVVQTGDG